MLETRLRELHQERLADLIESGAGFIKKDLVEADLNAFDHAVVKKLINGLNMYRPLEGAIEPVEIIPAGFSSTPIAGQYYASGEKLISEGKIAVVVVAGGQGSRLGISVPKGAVEVSPVKHKSLFQIHSEKILALKNRLGTPIHFFIMTSRANDKDTKAFFARNSYFGLNENEVHFFIQGMLPSFATDGQFILSQAGGLFMNPDGHGGTFAALRRTGCIDLMKTLGIEELFYFQVDNPLVKICDPLFIGLHREKGAQMSSKILKKRNPEEKVGVIAKTGGKTCVVEYSDMPRDLLYAKDRNGAMLYWAGSIAIHMISVAFADRITSEGFSIPFHKAVKKIQTLDDSGRPLEINGIKYEGFVFDALPLTTSSVTLEVRREEEFAPVKNATGEDSLESSKEMQSDLHRSWLAEAGLTVPSNAVVEISPLFALDAGDVIRRASQIPGITEKNIYLE
jgi:UDP-N-acetylglucosamine/UDP-N-acetylgalactosamine diphosphorylase